MTMRLGGAAGGGAVTGGGVAVAACAAGGVLTGAAAGIAGVAAVAVGRGAGGGGTGTVCRGSEEEDGVTMRGAEGAATAAGLGAWATGAFAGGRLEAGATVTGGRTAGGGVDRATASACLRSSMAFNASPGLETWERLNSCRASTGARGPAEVRLPRLMWPRTFSASSSSMELECVFFSVTPTAVKASRMDLLLTSSSRARSLIRTLLIRSFSKKLPFAPSWS